MKKFTCAIAMLVIATFMIFVSSCKKEESNNNPTISAVVVNPAAAEANSMVNVTVTASDPDGDALTYTYTVSGGAIQGNGATAIWTAPSQSGSFSVTVTISDGNGGSASGNGSLTVTASPTQITGTASFPAGTSGDLSNAKVSIYTSIDNWYDNAPIKFGTVSGSGASVTFALTDLNPGNYYLDVWKDMDNNAGWSTGDYIGWYGSGGLGSPSLTEIQITQGQTVNVSLSMFIIEGASTSLSGNATLVTGTAGDLANSIVGLYLTIQDFLSGSPYEYTVAVGSGASVGYEFTGTDPGLYYLGIWKDTDGNLEVSAGDFLGWYGSGTPINPNPVQIEVIDGEAVFADMTVFLIAEIQNPTSITGTAILVDGASGDLVNSKAYLYTSLENWGSYNPEYTVNTTGSGTSVDFVFAAIVPGTYLLDVWKDTDNNGEWSEGDIVGVYGDIFNNELYEITIGEGETADFEITMYPLVGGSSEGGVGSDGKQLKQYFK